MRGHGAVAAVYCSAADFTAVPAIQAAFPSTLAGTRATGTCVAGLYGLPQLRCNADGTWDQADVQNACSGTCVRTAWHMPLLTAIRCLHVRAHVAGNGPCGSMHVCSVALSGAVGRRS